MNESWTVEVGGHRVPLAGPPERRDQKNVTLVIAGHVDCGSFVCGRIGFYLPAFASERLPRVFRPDGSEWLWPE